MPKGVESQGKPSVSAPDGGPTVVREKPQGEQMRAIIFDGFGGLDKLVYAEIPKPLPKAGEVVIRVKGFGLNHAEMYMRRGVWGEAAEVSGIECVGMKNPTPKQ
jgi:NADPH2:quinone reductase